MCFKSPWKLACQGKMKKHVKKHYQYETLKSGPDLNENYTSSKSGPGEIFRSSTTYDNDDYFSSLKKREKRNSALELYKKPLEEYKQEISSDDYMFSLKRREIRNSKLKIQRQGLTQRRTDTQVSMNATVRENEDFVSMLRKGSLAGSCESASLNELDRVLFALSGSQETNEDENDRELEDDYISFLKQREKENSENSSELYVDTDADENISEGVFPSGDYEKLLNGNEIITSDSNKHVDISRDEDLYLNLLNATVQETYVKKQPPMREAIFVLSGTSLLKDNNACFNEDVDEDSTLTILSDLSNFIDDTISSYKVLNKNYTDRFANTNIILSTPAPHQTSHSMQNKLGVDDKSKDPMLDALQGNTKSACMKKWENESANEDSNSLSKGCIKSSEEAIIKPMLERYVIENNINRTSCCIFQNAEEFIFDDEVLVVDDPLVTSTPQNIYGSQENMERIQVIYSEKDTQDAPRSPFDGITSGKNYLGNANDSSLLSHNNYMLKSQMPADDHCYQLRKPVEVTRLELTPLILNPVVFDLMHSRTFHFSSHSFSSTFCGMNVESDTPVYTKNPNVGSLSLPTIQRKFRQSYKIKVTPNSITEDVKDHGRYIAPIQQINNTHGKEYIYQNHLKELSLDEVKMTSSTFEPFSYYRTSMIIEKLDDGLVHTSIIKIQKERKIALYYVIRKKQKMSDKHDKSFNSAQHAGLDVTYYY